MVDAMTLATMPPQILAAYLRDPRLAVTQQMTKEGTSTSPVRSPIEGLARMGQAALGAYSGGRIMNDYGQKSTAYNQAMANAIKAMQMGGIDAGINAAASDPQLASDLGIKLATEKAMSDYKIKEMIAEMKLKNALDPEKALLSSLLGGGSVPPQQAVPTPPSNIPTNIDSTGGGGQYLPPVSNMNPMLPNLAKAESNNNPNAVSPKGAAGEYQIMPDTARDPGFGVQPLQNWDGKDPRTAPRAEQARFSNDYLNAMQARNGGNPQLAAAAYNAGPGAVDKAMANASSPQEAISQLPAETQNYVPKVAGGQQIIPNQSYAGDNTSQDAGFNPRGAAMAKLLNLGQGMQINAQGVPEKIPGTVDIQGGKVYEYGANGSVVERQPPNPEAKKAFEDNLVELKDAVTRLHKMGGAIEQVPSNAPFNEKAQVFANNMGNQLMASEGSVPMPFTNDRSIPLPLGKTFFRGSEGNVERENIKNIGSNLLFKYMQANNITPGMERAVQAQQMVKEAIGAEPGASFPSMIRSIHRLSMNGGQGDVAKQLEQEYPEIFGNSNGGWSIQRIQ